MQNVLSKIQSTGYWRVIVRPTVFNPVRLETLRDCRDAVRSSVVLLRGWDYPHWKEEAVTNGQDWIECHEDWTNHIEYWRYFQSGQFAHQFAMIEDYERAPFASFATKRADSEEPILSILSTLFTVTEIFEFASRLALKGLLDPEAQVHIELHNTLNRRLTFWDPLRLLYGPYVCKIPVVTYSLTLNADRLLSESNALALNATHSIFERFNWGHVPMETLAEDQRKLIERRL